MLDNKFIWGIDIAGDTKNTSFATWNDAYIYYNRKLQIYIMEIDLSDYKLTHAVPTPAWQEIERLSKIDEAFRNFLIENDLPVRASNIPFWNSDLRADTLTELYTKFRAQFEGYKWYFENKPQD